MKKTRLTAVALAVLMTSCATPYMPNLLLGGGYSDHRIDDNHYQVMFDGNGLATSDHVWYFWFYRCAELTKERGYANFTLEPVPAKTSLLEDEPKGAMLPAVYTPGTGGGIIKVHGGGGGGGHMIFVPGVGGGVTTWHSNGIVGMYHDDFPVTAHVVYRAQAVLDALDAYVKSNGTTPVPARADVAREAAFDPNYVAPFWRIPMKPH